MVNQEAKDEWMEAVTKASIAQAKILYEGFPNTDKPWDDLFHYEKDKILLLLMNAEHAWWQVMNEYNEKWQLTHDARENGLHAREHHDS